MKEGTAMENGSQQITVTVQEDGGMFSSQSGRGCIALALTDGGCKSITHGAFAPVEDLVDVLECLEGSFGDSDMSTAMLVFAHKRLEKITASAGQGDKG
jgi:hypothetical protein